MTTLRLLIILGVVLLASILGTASCATNKDMAPNITDGTVYWVWPQKTYDVGDVIVMADPHTSTTRLRRIVARTSDEVYIESDGIVVNKRRLPQLDMRPWNEEARVWQELSTNQNGEVTWEFIQANSATNFKTNNSTVPQKHVFVICDNRSECIDSRWWGAVPEEMIYGKIIWSLCLFCNDDGY